MDGELDRLFLAQSPAFGPELACGLVAASALVAALIRRPRLVVSRIKWEMILFLIVLLLCMTPTAGLFRWSFRWLPFFHLILAICAAEVLQTALPSTIAAVTALALVVITGIAVLIFHTAGAYAFPLTWTFVGLTAVWFCSELLLRNSE